MGNICKWTSLDRPYPGGKTAPSRMTYFVLFFSLIFPASSFALDGRIEIRGTQQDGGAGESAYETLTLWENYSLSQRILLRKNLILQFDFINQRQTLDATSVLSQSNSEIISYLPNASLTYRANEFRAGLNTRGIRKDHSGSNLQSWRDDHVDFNGWLRNSWQWIEIDANAQESSSQRNGEFDNRDTREHSQSVGVRLYPTQNDELRYNFSHNAQDLRTFDTSITYLSHQIQYQGSHGFAQGRGRISLDARGSYLKQISTFGQDISLSYLAPIWGGFSLDDTPEEQDSLEDDPVFTSNLYNQDRDTATIINIGDSAPVVRQYGGDYRNIIYDFGDTEAIDQLVLYVDTVLRFPDLMQWRVFTSNDPEGRDWSNELNASEFTAVWEEMANGRQGWRFDFTSTINHRRIKVVNYKLGLTEPDIHITEMEIYETLDQSTPDQKQNVQRHRLLGDLSFKVTKKLGLLYTANFTGRHFDESNRDVKGKSHRFGANWVSGSTRFSASHEIDKVRNSTGQDTDANSQRVSLSNRFSQALLARVAWTRTDDNSFTLRHKTQTASGNVSWRAAPRLTFIQKISYGIRDAESLEIDSRSWTLSTTVRGRPRPNWEIELRRKDRWVSEEAGADFSTFNNTELQSTWALLPLVTLTTQIKYQVRDEEDILVRNSLVWNPYPGGSMTVRLHANDYQDTRTDWFQRGAGGMLVWRPRPRLYLESGVEWVLVKQYDDRNTPTNIQFRGSWSF